VTVYLAWLKTQKGVEAQVWRDLATAQQHYAINSPRGVLHANFITKLPIKPEDESLSVDQLKERYPCPGQ
jgi:hypothetical protein